MQIRKGLLILVIVFACLASYFNSLFGDFVWDDGVFIVENSYIKSFRYLPQFFSKDFWSIYIESMPSHYYRPFLAFSFMVDYALWKENPLGFHISNLIFHILSSLLVFIFIGMLAKDKIIAFASALIFSVHPINVESVSFISGRVDTLPCVFYLLSLVLFLRYVNSNRYSIYLFSLICFFIALLTKEMAITLPLIVICIDYLFLSRGDPKKIAQEFLKLHLGFFIVLGIYLLMRTYTVGWGFVKSDSAIGINFHAGTTVFWRPLTAIKILVLYIRLLFFPYNLNVDHMFAPVNYLFEPVVLIGIALLSSFAYTFAKNIKSHPLLSFSVIWFCITILPVSNLIPQGNIFAERYIYIPSIGFCLGIGFLFSLLLQKDVKTKLMNYKKSMILVFILLILALGRITYERNKVWENDFTLWFDAIKSNNESSRAHYNLGRVYFNINEFNKALRHYNLALQSNLGITDEMQAQILYNSGHAFLKKGLRGEAKKAYEYAILVNPREAGFYNSLGIIYGLEGNYEKAIETCLKAIEIDSELSDVHYNLALNYRALGQFDKAINSYEESLRLNPGFANVHVDVGYLYKQIGNNQKARGHWLKALEISGDYQPALEALELLEE